jgi:hypothetical protein
MLATINDTDRGTVVNFDGVHALLPSNDPAYAPTIPAMRELVGTLTKLAETIKLEALPSALFKSTAARNAIAATSVTYGGLVQRKRDAETAERKAWERAPSVTDDKHDAEWIRLYRDLPASEQAQRALTADLAELTPIALNPALAGLHDKVQEIVADRYVALNFADKVGLAGSYPARPSLEGDILATGVDNEAVEKASQVALAQHKRRIAQSEADEAAMRNIVAVLATAFAMPPEDVLAAILP